MIDVSNCQDRWKECWELAEKIGLKEQLLGVVDYLDGYANGRGCTYDKYHGKDTRCRLFKDFAPFSFEFVMDHYDGKEWKTWFNGGVIFHGPHDGYGNGGAPTYSVSLGKHDGWQVHT